VIWSFVEGMMNRESDRYHEIYICKTINDDL